MYGEGDLTSNEIIECNRVILLLKMYSNRHRDYLISKGESIGTFKKRRFVDVSNVIVNENSGVLKDKRLFTYVSKYMDKIGYTIKFKENKNAGNTEFILTIALNQYNIKNSNKFGMWVINNINAGRQTVYLH